MKNVETLSDEMTFANDPIELLNTRHSALLQRHRQEGETPALLNDIEAFIRQGQRAGTILTREADRWVLQGILDFWVAILNRAGCAPPDATLAELDEEHAPKFRNDECPYLGLAVFGETDGARFFGRQPLLDELITKLAQNHLVAVVGPSGSGASSLVFAGLIPLLKKGEAMPGSQDWRYLPPVVPGSNPLLSLARSLLSSHDGSEDFVTQIERQVRLLQTDPARVVTLLQDATGSKPAVLIIDQFEEAFTLCAEERARNAFIDALVVLIQQPALQIKLILTMRVAYRGRIARLQNATFKQCFGQGLILVKSPEDDELRAMIEQPARAIGLNLEREVVDELVADVRGEPSATYLLQDTLVRLWALRDYNWITMDAYRKLGGAKYALVQGAKQTYAELSPEEQKIARELLLRLVQVGIDREAVCRRVLRSELLQNHKYEIADAEQVLDKLTVGRVVRQSRTDSSSDAQVELMHEALIQNWPELRTWLWDHWEELRQRQRLTDNAHLWEEGGHSDNLLLQGEELDAAQSLKDLDPLEEQYVRTSTMAKLKASKRQKQIYLGVITALVAVVLVVSLLAAVTWNAKQEAVQAQNTANGRLASLLSSEAELAMTTKPQLSLLLAVEAVDTSPQMNGKPVVTETLLALQQALSTTTSYPLRRLDKQVITDAVHMAVSPNGEWLAAGSQSGKVHLWSLTRSAGEFEQVGLSAHVGEVTALAFSPDGRWLSTGGSDAVVNLFNMQALDARPIQVKLSPTNAPVTALAFAPSSYPTQTWLAVSNQNGVVQRIELPASASPIVSDLLGEQSRSTASLAFSPDAKWLATVSVTDTLRLWQLESTALPRAARLLNEGEKNSIVAFSPDGRWLAAGSKADPIVYLYQFNEKRQDVLSSVFVLPGHVQGVYSMGFTPDHQSLMVGSGDGIVRLWRPDPLVIQSEVEPSKQVKPIPTRPGFSVSPGQPSSEPTDKNSEIKRVTPSIEPLRLRQRVGAVLALTFRTDQENHIWLAAAGADQAVELWKVSDLTKPQSIFYGHEAEVESALIVAKANLLLARGHDGTIRIWRLTAQERAPQDLTQLLTNLPMWMTEACQRAGREFSADEQAEYLGDLQVKSACTSRGVSARQ